MFPINDSAGILFILAGNAALWFFLEKHTKWKVFHFFPPLIFIYLIPGILSNTGVLPLKDPTYSWMRHNLLPAFLVLLLLDVDVRGASRVMGRGLLVMFAGTLGVVIGGPIAFALVKGFLSEGAWKGFGALAGSWIGGTGNMAAVGGGLETSSKHFGLAIIADHAIYLVWLPLLLYSKSLAPWFHRMTGASQEHLDKLKQAAEELVVDKGRPEMWHILLLLALAFGATFLANTIAPLLPVVKPVLGKSTYTILLVTTFGLILSQSPARKIPGSHILSMAMVYLFVARMGATASIQGLAGEALPFVAGAFVWILIHGAFLLLAAKLLHADVHTTAIASAANIGGAASAPVVAAYHDERLVPVSILMALMGYAVGNYAAFATAWLCSLIA
ncbi:MAG: hypothetical protein CL920_06780 [Deltaproteobacteria bacterium]|nr:hypothetical protein [Deltaproteobacteria bacterium]MBU48386.1 hypothetical protein [Deltaproteobacteria bacterium]|tara:strand:- start:2350 stop:3513 length:1164 start_codon:yes stop_codon:yes gene_type:complete